MKISEMTNDQAADAMIRIVAPIERLTKDERLEPLLEELAGHEGEGGVSALKIISSMLPRIVPMLLKDHRTDLFEIISILSGERVEKVGGMKLSETVHILKESIDDELIGFFRLSGRQIMMKSGT